MHLKSYYLAEIYHLLEVIHTTITQITDTINETVNWEVDGKCTAVWEITDTQILTQVGLKGMCTPAWEIMVLAWMKLIGTIRSMTFIANI